MTKENIADWERIKKIIDSYGLRKGFKKGEFLNDFITELNAYQECCPENVVYWNDFYSNVISIILKKYSIAPLSKLLDNEGNYIPLQDDRIEHMLNEELIMKEWRDSFKK